MKEATFEYKCRKCSQIDRNPNTSESNALQILVAATMNVPLANSGSLQPKILSVHACGDGGHGISDLIGYSVKE